jgi:multidrug resistance protein, MATE family
MNAPSEKSDDSQRLAQRFGRLAVPNVVAALWVPLAGVVDMAMLGHLESIAHLAGVAFASVLFDALYGACASLRMVTTGLSAQFWGRDEHLEGALLLLRAMAVAFVFAALLLLLQRPLGDIGFSFLGGEPDVQQSGRTYFDARIWGAPAVLVNYVIIGWLLGREQSVAVLILSVAANTLNVFLDYIFIYRLDLMSAGAGWATSFSQWAMALAGVMYLGHLDAMPKWAMLRSRLWEGAAWRSLLGFQYDLLIRTLSLQGTFALFTYAGARMGTSILAANAVLLKALSLASFFIDGYAYAAESLAGIYHGQKKRDLLRRLLRLTLSLSVVTGVGWAILCMVFSNSIFSLMTDHDNILHLINDYAFWLFPVMGTGAIAYAFDGYCVGLTLTVAMRRSMLLAFFVFAPLALASLTWQSNHALWASMWVFMGVRALSLCMGSAPSWRPTASIR